MRGFPFLCSQNLENEYTPSFIKITLLVLLQSFSGNYGISNDDSDVDLSVLNCTHDPIISTFDLNSHSLTCLDCEILELIVLDPIV